MQCPECGKPNQFGEMCESCRVEFERVQRARAARQHEFDTDMTGQDEEAFNGEDA